MAAAVVSAVRDIVGSAVQIHTSLDDALRKCGAQDVASKQWAIVERGDSTMTDIQKALTADQKQLGVVVVATKGPVKQVEALRAMEYGEVFVAAAEFVAGAKDASDPAVAALRQAAAYAEGPTVILLADPKAVRGDEQWTPFRYDPRCESSFVADGPRVRREIEAFLARENLLTLVAKKAVGSGEAAEADSGALSQGLADAGKTVTVLYTSDTGHAEECAKAVARQCRGGGYAASAVRCGTLDSFDINALASEPLLVLCVATAGKGEFPGNGRNFWNKLSERATEMKGTLSSVKFAVFGLGDSHYWGKGTEESRVNFAKPARELDELLESLGATRFMPIGFGDDQDVDQYHTGFGEWKSQLYSRLGVDKAEGGAAEDDGPVKTDEVIKTETRQLRGSLKETLDDIATGQVPFQDTKLIKFHGSYQQDDRDLREERQKLGIENAFSFMIRVRLPGGYCTAEQWLAMDEIAGRYANGTLKITTRQTWQLHGVLKRDVKNTMRGINRACMDTIAACGDVCRNVLCTSNPGVCSRELMDEIMGYTYAIHDHCLPRTGAYHEIFLMHGDEMAEKSQVMGTTPIEEEPLYGKTYLPRKFKVAVAIPPSNDVDVFAHCCGFIAIIEGGKLQGFNVTVGGGLGFTHNNQKTFPRLADVIGFCKPEDAKYVCEVVLTVQRDFGDRTGRKHARIKYTMEDYGPAWYREQVEERLGKKLEDERPYKFEHRGDLFGWVKTDDGLWHCGCLVPIGRVKEEVRMGLAKIAEELKGCGAFRLTCNQSVLITEVPEAKKAAVEKLLAQYKVPHSEETTVSGLRRNMMACVALPTCPLAFAEAERYLPTLVGRLEAVVERCGLRDTDVVIRMTGCPNSCGRPSMGEIGFIGKAPGTYNMYLGGDFVGRRLNTLFAESVTEDQIVELLTPIFGKYAGEREKEEKFGDFCVRKGYVKAMTAGRHWWTLPQV
mmetsp:Transcript_69813/g.161496  ORF Transcript_69813/g.161496 Transcript_69813/m.161496 type:complete len:952 (+) Transcript_69813:47-2902(+)|eukprot:CAMPEP_0171060634 /NCGR_PEP_ID=MMETSP0766_2-20121228/3951_1 /TAXON_ID=439317 /ORGANISM="Gambierdiscus australes, Strain CAWD 149" /LENGTH=951 /DNA_ID=CAMNT_0011516235 /DNA_START=37 /DNA_END=2892 /DNA_ORIENTATION=+